MVSGIESRRNALQEELDARKTPAERNKLGQFATPFPLAVDIIGACKALLPSEAGIRFLDPALGTGSFYSALLQTFHPSRIRRAIGFEIDPHYGRHAASLWQGNGLEVRIEDFTTAQPPSRDGCVNLIVCNPPYVRHHHIGGEEKRRLQRLSATRAGVRLSGLAGLYCHFFALSHAWLAEGGAAAWLIPSEFMDVNYGAAIKEYLLRSVTLHRVHRFDPSELQFADALVSSAVLLFKKSPAPDGHEVVFTYGGSLPRPRACKSIPVARLRREPKWTRHPLEDLPAEPPKGSTDSLATPVRLSDLFHIKRGLASGANGYFLMTAAQAAERGIPDQFLTPVLPSPRHVPGERVEGDRCGHPVLDRQLFLFGSNLPEPQIRQSYPRVWAYLVQGKANKVDEAYLCRHRSPWYAHEDRPAAPIVCTYMSRSSGGRQFRFIRNRSRATATNVYLMLYPKPRLARLVANKPALMDAICDALNRIRPESLVREGRVYGGGLYKLEPRELANVPVDALVRGTPELAVLRSEDQPMLFPVVQ